MGLAEVNASISRSVLYQRAHALLRRVARPATTNTYYQICYAVVTLSLYFALLRVVWAFWLRGRGVPIIINLTTTNYAQPYNSDGYYPS